MQERFINVAGGKICYQKREGKKKALIFLHGGGGSISSWGLVRPYFAKSDHTLIFVDLRGHGRSFRPKIWEDYQIEKHAEDLLRLTRKTRQRRVVLIGHCLGSMVAATFAACYPQKVAKLILINPGEKDVLPPFFRLGKILTTIIYIIIVKFKAAGGETGGGNKKRIKRVDYRKFAGSGDLSLRRLWADLRVMGFFSALCQARAFFAWRAERYFSQINLPTLIISGKKDIIFPPSKAGRVQRFIKNAQFALLKTNHISVINNPKEIAGQILRFLEP